MNANLNAEDLRFYLDNLDDYRKSFVKRKNYDDAEVSRAKIAEIKRVIDVKKKKEIEENQVTELKGLESLFSSELEKFNKEQELKLREFEETARSLEEQLKTKQISEMDALYKDFEEKYTKKTKKYSKEVLELKAVESGLVKMQRYKEAKVILNKVEEMIKEEDTKLFKEKDEKMKGKIDKLIQKHQGERNSLKAKIDLDLNMLKKAREKELETINHKYKNKKQNLENQQKNEKYLADNTSLKRSKTSSNLLIRKITSSNIKTRNEYQSPKDIKAKLPKNTPFQSKRTNMFSPPKTAISKKTVMTEKFQIGEVKTINMFNKSAIKKIDLNK